MSNSTSSMSSLGALENSCALFSLLVSHLVPLSDMRGASRNHPCSVQSWIPPLPSQNKIGLLRPQILFFGKSDLTSMLTMCEIIYTRFYLIIWNELCYIEAYQCQRILSGQDTSFTVSHRRLLITRYPKQPRATALLHQTRAAKYGA